MSRYILTNDVKGIYAPIVQEFIKKLEANEEENPKLNLSDTKLNPYTLIELLEELGYSKEDQDENGWQMDFWITMTKQGCKSLCIGGTGITFELNLSER
jgi:hypothetical protein